MDIIFNRIIRNRRTNRVLLGKEQKMKCENCSHAEMCKWIDELEGRGCDFFDGEQEPCDAISREAVINIVKLRWDYYKNCIEAIEKLPSVTPSRRKGHWLKTGQSFLNPNKFRNFCCTECLHELDEHIRKEPNYCPNCGAEMESKE